MSTPAAAGPEARQQRADRRDRAVALLACATGSLLVVGAAGRPWARVQVAGDALTGAVPALTGRDLAPAVAAVGLAGVAAVAALVATRGVARRIVGALVVLFGAVILVGGATATDPGTVRQAASGSPTGTPTAGAVHTTGWPWVARGGGVLLLAAGTLTVWRGGRWPGLSSRHDAPQAQRANLDPGRRDGSQPGRPGGDDDPAALWAALDRGEDPTAGPTEGR